MIGRNAIAALAISALVLVGSDSLASGQDRPAGVLDLVDVQPRPLDSIPPGTVIDKSAPKGWTDLILLATPRVGVGDVADVSKTVASYSSMFRFAILGKVRGDAGSGYNLEKVGLGLAVPIDGRNVVVDSEHTFDADLGLIGRSVLSENEKILKDEFRQVARSATMLVFDAKVFVLRDGKHRPMVLRHAILASPTTGNVSTFAWLLGSDGAKGYDLAEKGLQKLPRDCLEDRVLSVDAGKFTLGIPSTDAFALAKIPQGTALGFSPAFKAVAATKGFTPDSARRLEAELRARYAPVAARSTSAAQVRR